VESVCYVFCSEVCVTGVEVGVKQNKQATLATGTEPLLDAGKLQVPLLAMPFTPLHGNFLASTCLIKSDTTTNKRG